MEKGIREAYDKIGKEGSQILFYSKSWYKLPRINVGGLSVQKVF